MKASLHQETASAVRLGIVRVVVYSLWLSTFLTCWPGRIHLSSTLVMPPGIFSFLPASLIEWMLSPTTTAWLPWTFVPVVMAAALGLKPFRLWSGLAPIAILCFDAWLMSSSGYVFHARTFALLMALVLTFSPAADGFSLTKRHVEPPRPSVAYQFPIFVMLAAGLLCYTFIGVHRLAYGDTAVFHGESLRAWLLVRSQQPAETSFKLGLLIANAPFWFAVYKIGFVVTTMMEVLSLLCLFSRKFALGWLIFMSVFHILSLFTLNIFFWENTLLLWLLILPMRNQLLPTVDGQTSPQTPLCMP